MVVSDPIGDMLIQIKNAVMAGKHVVELPHSSMKHAVATILSQEGYIGTVEKTGNSPKLMLRIHLKYQGDAPVLTGVKRISKPGLRWYVGKNEIPEVLGGLGIAIVSTPQGVMSGKEAKKRGVGGELLCTVW